MCKYFLNILLLLIVSLSCQAATSAEEIMKKAVDKHLSSKGISATYTITGKNIDRQMGNIKVQNDKFTINNKSLSIWYDGKTEWDYNIANNEVTIVYPTSEDLSMVNPYYIISNYKNLFKASVNQSKIAGTYSISLIPKSSDNAIKKIVLYLRTSDYQPLRADIMFDNNEITTIIISNFKSGQNFSNSTFVFPAKTYPNAEIIDLR